MDKKIKILFTVIVLVCLIFSIYSFIGRTGVTGHEEIHTNATIMENGSYIKEMDVAEYIDTYHKLPHNYISKKNANKLGWRAGPVDKYAPGKSIGGDVFTNEQGVLPRGEKYIECDINNNGSNPRNAERIVFSLNDYDIYYTNNHYKSFTELT